MKSLSRRLLFKNGGKLAAAAAALGLIDKLPREVPLPPEEALRLKELVYAQAKLEDEYWADYDEELSHLAQREASPLGFSASMSIVGTCWSLYPFEEIETLDEDPD